MDFWIDGVDIAQGSFNTECESTDENLEVEPDKYPTEVDGPVDEDATQVDSGIFPAVAGIGVDGLPVGPGGFPVLSGWSGLSLAELKERFGRDIYEGDVFNA